MTSFLFIWDSNDEHWGGAEYYLQDIRTTISGGTVSGRWSVGSRRSGMNPGDRAFLLRQKIDRGIVASGHLTDGAIYEDTHYADPQRTAWYTTITWDHIVAPEDRLPIEELLASIPGHKWNNVYGSGQELQPPADSLLEKRWQQHLRAVRAT